MNACGLIYYVHIDIYIVSTHSNRIHVTPLDILSGVLECVGLYDRLKSCVPLCQKLYRQC